MDRKWWWTDRWRLVVVDRQMEAGSGGQTDGGWWWWTDRWRLVVVDRQMEAGGGGQTDGGK